MNETHRTNLLTACAYAKVLIEAADREIRGGSPSWREEAALELQAALRNLTTPPPDVETVDWQKIGAVLDGTVHPTPHIDSDRRRGPSDWDRECQESRRLNR
jgi:hypothetical protein